MKNSLYEYFDCSNREELYKKIKDEKEEVKEFIEYLNYAKNNLENENLKFRSRNDVKNYLNTSYPNKNELQVLMFDSNSNLLSDNKIDLNSSFREMMKASYIEKAKSVILVYNDFKTEEVIDNRDKIRKLADNLEDVGFIVLDRIRIDKNMKIFSSTNADMGELEKSSFSNKKELNTENKYRKIINSKKYNEFMVHYAEKELLGLNIITDENKIKDILKVSFQEEKQENFGIIEYDDKYKISKVDILFKGGVSKTTLDKKIIIPILLKDEIKGITVFHNHPSGSITPSKEDIEATKSLSYLTEKLDKQLLDHYVVAKEGVFSFKDEWLIENHSSKALEEIKKQEKEKINQYKKESKVPGKKNPWVKPRSRSRESENER